MILRGYNIYNLVLSEKRTKCYYVKQNCHWISRICAAFGPGKHLEKRGESSRDRQVGTRRFLSLYSRIFIRSLCPFVRYEKFQGARKNIFKWYEKPHWLKPFPIHDPALLVPAVRTSVVKQTIIYLSIINTTAWLMAPRSRVCV